MSYQGQRRAVADHAVATSLIICSGTSIDLLVLGKVGPPAQETNRECTGQAWRITATSQSLVFADLVTLEWAELGRLRWPSSFCLILFFPHPSCR